MKWQPFKMIKQRNERLVSKETAVSHRRGSETSEFGMKHVDMGQILTKTVNMLSQR